MKRLPGEVLRSMEVWRKYGSTPSVLERSESQRAWDSGVLAASEFVRRMTGDEQLAGLIHGLLTFVPTPPPSAGTTEEA